MNVERERAILGQISGMKFKIREGMRNYSFESTTYVVIFNFADLCIAICIFILFKFTKNKSVTPQLAKKYHD